MFSLAVIEESGGKITRDIKAALKNSAQLSKTKVIQAQTLGELTGDYDLLILASMQDEKTEQTELTTKTLLLSDQFPKQLAFHVPTLQVVTYGFSLKDSITLSSLEPQQAVLTLQRAIFCLNSQTLEQQEIPLKIPEGAEAGRVMAVSAALLLLGKSPLDL